MKKAQYDSGDTVRVGSGIQTAKAVASTRVGSFRYFLILIGILLTLFDIGAE